MNDTHCQVSLRFNDYSSYLRKLFGERVQKISLNTGYSCPNRDGTKAYHGCTYCNITSIQPAYTRRSMTLTTQLQYGIDFFASRNKTSKYLAYFQSYSNTYRELERAKYDYEEALRFPGVVGLVIGTRPDCVSADMAKYLEDLALDHYISVEIGIESTNDDTLKRVNRCHTFGDVVECMTLLRGHGLRIGAHLILGFPWETKTEMLEHADKISDLPIDFLKLHHLQILKHTQLEQEYKRNCYSLLDQETYLELVTSFVERSRPDLIFQRFLAEAPKDLLIAPNYNGLRNYAFTQLVNDRLMARETVQGQQYKASVM